MVTFARIRVLAIFGVENISPALQCGFCGKKKEIKVKPFKMHLQSWRRSHEGRGARQKHGPSTAAGGNHGEVRVHEGATAAPRS